MCVLERIVGEPAVAHADIEHAVGADFKVPAIVIGKWLVHGQNDFARVRGCKQRIAGSVLIPNDFGVAREIGVIDIK